MRPNQSMAQACARALETHSQFADRREFVEPWMLRFARSVSSAKTWQTIRRVNTWFTDHVDFRGTPGFFADDDLSAERVAWDMLGGDAGERWASAAVAAGPGDDEFTGLLVDGDPTGFTVALEHLVDEAPTELDPKAPRPDSAATEFALRADDWADMATFERFVGRKPEWAGLFCFEEVMTSDNRIISAGALRWRKLPFTLQDQLLSSDGSHDGAVPVGPVASIDRIDSAEVARLTGGKVQIPSDAFALWATGMFDTGPDGATSRRRMEEGTKQGVSVDLREIVLDLPDDPDEAIEHLMAGGEMRIASAVLTAATQVVIPAFEHARLMTVAGTDLADLEPEALVASGGVIDQLTLLLPMQFTVLEPALTIGEEPVGYSTEHLDALLASGSAKRPPSVWFDEVDYPEPTPFTVDEPDPDTGLRRMHGHLGLKGSCHIGFAHKCVDVPLGLDYSSFQGERATGVVRCVDGVTVHAGPIVMSTEHAAIRDAKGRTVPAGTSIDHYAHTGCLIGQGRCYEDRHGLYVTGWVLPDVTDEQLARLDACDLSPDWRPRATASGGQGVVALLTVPVSGFNTALAASAAPVDETPDTEPEVIEQAGWEVERDRAARKVAALAGLEAPIPESVASVAAMTEAPERTARKQAVVAALVGQSCSCGCRSCGA